MGAPNVKTGAVRIQSPIRPKIANAVVIKNPKPSKGEAVAAVSGKKFPPTAHGIRTAMAALKLKNILGDVPYKGVSGKMMVTFSIGKNGKVTSVKCERFGKDFRLFDSSEMPFKKLAGRVAGALANLQFNPGEKATVTFPLVFGLRWAK